MAKWQKIEAIGQPVQGHCIICDELFTPATEDGFREHWRAKHKNKSREDANQAAFRIVREATERH
jgi:hypothetical protein